MFFKHKMCKREKSACEPTKKEKSRKNSVELNWMNFEKWRRKSRKKNKRKFKLLTVGIGDNRDKLVNCSGNDKSSGKIYVLFNISIHIDWMDGGVVCVCPKCTISKMYGIHFGSKYLWKTARKKSRCLFLFTSQIAYGFALKNEFGWKDTLECLKWLWMWNGLWKWICVWALVLGRRLDLMSPESMECVE